MPELPEVETTVLDLKKEILGLKILDVWTDWPKSIKKPSWEDFKKEIKGKIIKDIKRRGKMILFFLSGDKVLLAHQKMTGHFLVGKWTYHPHQKRKWEPQEKGPFQDKVNDYLHLMFFLDDGRQLALSDLRKFAWVALYDKKKLSQIKELQKIGLDPLSPEFTFEAFEKRILATNKSIKQALMDQTLIAGIGNIYSDEILWKARIHPLQKANSLCPQQLRELYASVKEILAKALRFHGTTILSGAEEFRRPSGERGSYQEKRYVYRKTGKACPRCQAPIQRIKINQRSSHFCPQCQRLKSSKKDVKK